MTPERAIEYALSEEAERDAPHSLLCLSSGHHQPTNRPETLTAREQEVALLVGRGLTNRQMPRSSRSLSTQSQTTCAKS